MGPIHNFGIVLATYLVSKATSSPTGTLDSRSDNWCTFYTEDYCETRSGGVSYDVENDGIFQNGGPYLQCGTSLEFSLISYPPGDSEGTTPNHCTVFSQDMIDFRCNHLDGYGFTTGDGGYFRISEDVVCPEITLTEQRRDDANDTSELLTKRASCWLTFYDDPACEQQSGSDSYSTDNQGCFENGGAYAQYGYDDFDWHLEQWTGVDDYQCAIEMEHCVEPDWFIQSGPDQAAPCVHLDSIGLSSGFGSWKINRAGCP